jgi:hypothetical protein
VVKERTGWRGTGLPYPCNELDDEVGDDPGPVHLPSSVQCSKNSVTHGNSNPVRLFRIKDGDEEREESRTRLCWASVQSLMAYPSLGLGSARKQSFTYLSFRLASPLPPLLKL